VISDESEVDSEDLLSPVEGPDLWSPQTAVASPTNLVPWHTGQFETATSPIAQQAILFLTELEVWDLCDLHGSPPLKDTPADALLGRLQLLFDEVPYETFPEEFVSWVHDVAAGGMKQLPDGCIEAHRELLRCLLHVGATAFPLDDARGMAAERFYRGVLAWDALITQLRLVSSPILNGHSSIVC
jgi:hypothetical protein